MSISTLDSFFPPKSLWQCFGLFEHKKRSPWGNKKFQIEIFVVHTKLTDHCFLTTHRIADQNRVYAALGSISIEMEVKSNIKIWRKSWNRKENKINQTIKRKIRGAPIT